jgi:hypothetical protein
MNIYRLSLLTTSLNFFFSVSEKTANIRQICLNLLDEAASIAIIEAKKTEAIIGWQDITKQIPKILIDHGFKEIEIKDISLPCLDLECDLKTFLPRTGQTIKEWNNRIRMENYRILQSEDEKRKAIELAKKPTEVERLKRLLSLVEEINKNG